VIAIVAVAAGAGDGAGDGTGAGGCGELDTFDGESLPLEPQAVMSSATQQVTAAESSFRMR
jgi:hypothetical protein